MAAKQTATGEQRCGNCLFGLPRGDGVQACHRNAPRPMQSLTAQQGNGGGPVLELRWPQVAASDWCGEWEPNA